MFYHRVLTHRSIGDESYSREIFEEYITYLKEKAKEKERKREEEKVHDFICLWFSFCYFLCGKYTFK